jgi:ribosomal protein L7/L12
MGFALRKHDHLSLPVVAALRRGNKIEAITLLREDLQIGLKEAKEEIEQYLESQPALRRQMEEKQAAAARALKLWAIVLLGIAILAYFALIGA